LMAFTNSFKFMSEETPRLTQFAHVWSNDVRVLQKEVSNTDIKVPIKAAVTSVMFASVEESKLEILVFVKAWNKSVTSSRLATLLISVKLGHLKKALLKEVILGFDGNSTTVLRHSNRPGPFPKDGAGKLPVIIIL